MKRGQLTDGIQEIAKSFLGREITLTELRLYPYLDFVMKNEQWIDPSKISREERHILSQLRREGHIDYYSETYDDKSMRKYLSLSKEFYDYINRVLWFSYVVQEDPSQPKEE